jgi:hypothetical protein
MVVFLKSQLTFGGLLSGEAFQYYRSIEAESSILRKTVNEESHPRLQQADVSGSLFCLYTKLSQMMVRMFKY